MPESLGDAAQTRRIIEPAAIAAAEMAVSQFVAQHPEFQRIKPEIPAPLKWAGGITAALLATGVGGTAVWLMTTVNEMQVTIARIDERIEGNTATLENRFSEHERRLQRLEIISGNKE